jgi:hypothetical protein
MARIGGSDIAHAVPLTLVAGIGHWFLGSVDWRLLSNVDELVVHENESIYIPNGAIHRLENPGKILLELIEVQTGSYLGEEDRGRVLSTLSALGIERSLCSG